MALFTDGPLSSIEDLTGQDTQLLEVANVEGIDVTRKLALAQDELGVELGTLLSRVGYPEQALWSAPAGISSVVATPPLKLWHTFRTLEMVYRDTYHNQLNDRYGSKRDEFREMAEWAYEKLIQSGVGVAADPVSRAATPDLGTAPGSLPAGTYYATTAWINKSGEEGACATPAAISVAGTTLSVSPANAPQNAAAWNVYVGASPEILTRQNASPIAAGQTWVQPNMLATAGRTPGSGQIPNYMRPVPRVIQRG